MSKSLRVVFPFDFGNDDIQNLKKSLKDLSKHKIDFYDKKWVCDKLANNEAVDSCGRYTLYFTNTPEQYNDWIRYYALEMYRTGARIATINRNITDIKEFFQFLEKYCDSISLEDVEIAQLTRFREYLKKSELSEDTKHAKWSCISNFYIKMKGANGYFNVNIVDKNPFKKIKHNDSKYISDCITKQLDDVFKDESIPISMRAAYWIMRFIPSRIQEVYKISIDSIKYIKNGWTLTLYMYKQNGGYYEPELRMIKFKNGSMEGEFLLNILEQQRAIAESLQDNLSEELKGYFFTYHAFNSRKQNDGRIKYFNTKDILVACEGSITYFLSNVCKKYDIRDKEGELARISSHRLRHNGITDRLSSDGGFDTGDVASITNHKNDSMIFKNYNHPTQEQILQSQENVYKTLNSKEYSKPIYFQGKIMNINPTLEKRLLRDLKKHKTKLGICSDSEDCKHQYRCLEDCDFYIPNCDDLEYFENEIYEWNRKAEFYKAKNMTIRLENAEYNLGIHIKVRDRILNMIKEEENG
ncbi:phage integrase SAM-like domain-containing protein [uncultured Clostridium sp.]|uniref:phage integrase SAM-like domain-containing protein n=1 Tax=uncultured Clostridium sp. TaxID=59620 RepID=UPI002609A6FF|nr:phage integrase SAM-like domain-containing protein [uncultured Clostridium sp.]